MRFSIAMLFAFVAVITASISDRQMQLDAQIKKLEHRVKLLANESKVSEQARSCASCCEGAGLGQVVGVQVCLDDCAAGDLAGYGCYP